MTHDIPTTFIDQANKSLYHAMLEQGLERWIAKLPEQLELARNKENNSNIPQWQSAVNRLPQLENPVTVVLQDDRVGITTDFLNSEYRRTDNLLKQLMPWRKGPYGFGSLSDSTDPAYIHIDTEWRSDFKWQRVHPHISDLTNRKVLDVGGGNGYHAWRMAGAGASYVQVVDPSPLFYHQFMAVKHFVNQDKTMTPPNVHFLPIGIEQVPAKLEHFDTVFSMGVLYHRPAPFEHLQQLKDCLRKGGELILETLVVEGDETTVLVPNGRYASMHNVYFFPSSAALCVWLEKAGFSNIRIVDEGNTDCEEQRQTDWMTFHSLAQFLDPDDPTKTIEGHPAPRRAVIVACKS